MTQIKREYIRHPSNIPLEVVLGKISEACLALDVAEGGLCFISEHAADLQQGITIAFPLCTPTFTVDGFVRWCLKTGNQYLVGVAFRSDAINYAVRMVEQVCHIENYREQIKQQQGIELSSQEAANQWIQKYAAEFPSSYS